MDPSSIPKQYGGELDWQWGDMPYLDEPARELVSALETAPEEGQTKPSFIKGPVLFKGDRVDIIGKENGKARESSIPVPKSKLAEEKEAAATKPDDNEQEQQPVVDGSIPVTEEKEASEKVTEKVTEKPAENGVATKPVGETEPLTNAGANTSLPTQTVSA
jgi:hypothetical protein